MSVVFKNGFAEGFAFAIPEAFADALKHERFKIGDVFYVSKEGYEIEWGKYLKRNEKFIEVAGFENSDLVIKIFRANKSKTAAEEIESRKVSSDELLKILRSGL